VKQEDNKALATLRETVMSQFNNATEPLRKWGGGIMGKKTQSRIAKREAAAKAEERKMLKLVA